MGRIVVTAFITVDGVIQGPGMRDEDRDGGFELGGWTRPYSEPVVDQRVVETVLAADALLLGRRTYELFASYWPHADTADPRTSKLNSQPKYVASRTFTETETQWTNTTLLRGDLVEQITKLKQGHDEISVWGSSTLIPPLLDRGLIDEFVLLVYPIVLGTGKRLFPEGHAFGLDLVDALTSTSGVAIHTYRRAELPRLS